MKKIFVSIIIFIAVVTSTNAQYNTIWNVNFQMTQATGDVREYVGEFSPRGIEFEARHFLNPSFAIGVKIAWSNIFERADRNSYELDENISMNSIQRRYLSSLPIMANIAWFPLEYYKENTFYPYISIGAGTVWTQQETDNSLYFASKEQWSMAVNPEIGTLIQFDDNFAVNLKIGYTWGTFDSLEDSNVGDIPLIENYGMMSYSIGFTFMY